MKSYCQTLGFSAGRDRDCGGALRASMCEYLRYGRLSGVSVGPKPCCLSRLMSLFVNRKYLVTP